LKGWQLVLLVAGAAATTGFGNRIVVYLAARVPGVVMFPVINGGVVILSIVISVLLFKEKLSRRGLLGLILGTLAICLLSLR
jgi:drug/metabolite transporter (DMT)-like permease